MVILHNEDQLSSHTLSSFIQLEFEPVGKWYDFYTYKKHQGDVQVEEEESDESSESSDEETQEQVDKYMSFLQTLDPSDCKNQDHYKVLGLEKLRHKATQHQIKKAHKKKVLRYHPDKQKQSGKKQGLDGEYFTCITKAFDLLSNPITRRSYDSVDPSFNDHVPSASENSKKNFFKVFKPLFEENSRFSIKKQVPSLGDESSTFDEVNDFYAFWYDFDSWREFSYLDEESKESAQDRDERRWIDKQNKAARLKRKKEEVTRVRQLVDNAYACDPRIIKFRQEEKRRKEEEKQKKKEAQKQREDEERRQLEEARLEREKREEEERVKLEAEKREKELQKKQLKKEKKSLRTTCKEFNYFAESEEERVRLMDEIERLIDLLKLQEIQSLNESIAKNQKELGQVKSVIMDMLLNLNKRSDDDKKSQETPNQSDDIKSSGDVAQSQCKEWTDDEIKLLVKGCKVIAVGTRDRWDVISSFIEEHSRGKYKRSGKEVLTKTKELQKLDPSVKDEVNKKAFEKTLQTIKQPEASVNDKPSERYETPGEQLLAEQGSNPSPWTAQEQKILEQAIKTYTASEPDRWDKIAECLPARSKKDCMMRYKELVALIQSKKKAQAKQTQN